MKLNKYITVAAIVLAVAVIVGFGQVTRENLASPKPKEILVQAAEGSGVQLEAPEGGNISEITFASYGNPIIGRNGKPNFGTCHADILSRVTLGCSGQTKCVIMADHRWWGDPCHGTAKKLIIGYTVYDPNAEAKAKEEEEAAATAKAAADAAAKAKAAAATPASTPATGAATTPAAATATGAATTAAATPAPAAASTDDDDVTPAPDNTMMYVAIGMGAIVLMMGVFMIASQPSPAPVVAGRRR
jgi:hypothetical protein